MLRQHHFTTAKAKFTKSISGVAAIKHNMWLPSERSMQEITNIEMYQHHEVKPQHYFTATKGHKTPLEGQNVFRRLFKKQPSKSWKIS